MDVNLRQSMVTNYRMQPIPAVVPWKYLQRLECSIAYVLGLQRIVGGRLVAGPSILVISRAKAQSAPIRIG